MKITINNKLYNVKIAETPEDQKKGLQGVSKLNENEGMLFIYDDEEIRQFWMKDTLIPLDIIGINDDLEVTSIHSGIPKDETLIVLKALYVLEVPANSKISIGDELDFNDDDIDEVLDDKEDQENQLKEDNIKHQEVDDKYDTKKDSDQDSNSESEQDNKMLVLDKKGKVLMELEGGERIFSRKNTRVLVKLAVHANKTKKDSDYKKLGKKIFKFLNIQDSNDPEFVELNKEEK